MATSFHVNVDDLMFILRQIKIAEAHSGGLSLTEAIQNEYGGTAADANLVPFGLRTVDGSLNNLAQGKENFGAADQTFPRMLDPIYVNDTDGDSIDMNGPAPGGLVSQGNYGQSGIVVDADPRTISNLIVDQSLNNPAAIIAALKYAGVEGSAATSAVAAIQAAHAEFKAAQQAAALAPAEILGLQAALSTETLELAAAQSAYDTAVANDTYAVPAALAATSQATADALVAAMNVVGAAIFGTNVDQTDIDNAFAAVAAAQAALAAAQDTATALAGLPEEAQALDAQNEMATLVTTLQTYASGLSLNEPVSAADELQQVVDAANTTAFNAGQAATLSSTLAGLVDPLGTVADALAALNLAQAEFDAAEASLLAAQNAGVAVDAAKAALETVVSSYGVEVGADGGLEIPNLSPDIGLSPAFNAWMTFFGQFFDHGLDLVPKAANGTVFIPLEADDPLIAGADGVIGTADDLPEHLRFMAVTRAAVDAEGNSINLTTPFVDQNQTYTSHASHQVFLREYVRADLNDGRGVVTLSTGALLDGTTASGSLNGAVANWGEVKAQARTMLGIELTDLDVGNVPWLRTDAYGELILSDQGYAQVIIGMGADGIPNTADDIVVSGTADAPVNPSLVGALRTGHAFLDDIAHHAVPGMVDHDHNPATPMVLKTADLDDGVTDDGDPTTYDNEMLDAHFITGDGRGNENIALSAVHSVFHSEHNRILEVNKHTILESGDLAVINEWLLVDLTAAQVAAIPTDPTALAAYADTLVWDGERMFQAARFTTEMQYQHLVFEEFARRIQPAVDPFVFTHSPDIDSAIVAEFAHTVYRFGHSMLTDTVDRFDNNLALLDGTSEQITLIEAFLNPQAFVASGATLEDVIGNIVRGATRDVGNEMDEFVVPSLQSNLLGLPLDLAAINIARGRETGIPSLNEARKQFYADYGLADLKPYTSWIDFAQHIKNPASIINFVAAYGTHSTITGVDTIEGKRAAAVQLLADYSNAGAVGHADAVAFMTATGIYQTSALGGMNNVDFWIGGLAEELNEFGGMLGSTFNLVFEFQMEKLQTGDRFYYLSRTQGTNLLNQLEPNTFTDLVMRNSSLGDEYATHLNPNLFVTPDHIFELDAAIAQDDYNDENTASQADGGFDPVHDDPFLQAIDPKVVRITGTLGPDGHYSGGYLKYSGGEHVVLGGTEGNDTLIGDKGIDGIWGDGGNDYINAGMESDNVFGGEGDDIIEDPFGDDVLRGEDGNDVISAGSGLDLIFGGDGQDYIIVGQDDKEAFGDEGDDFILGGTGNDFLLGNEGNDWIEGGDGFDVIAGDNSQLFFNSSIIGHDVAWGQSNDQDYDLESGDDIALSGPGIQRFEGMFGFDWAIGKYDVEGVKFDFAVPIFTTIVTDILKDRFDQIEAASGWIYDDILDGDDRGHVNGGSSSPDSVPVELFADHVLNEEGIDRIDGLRALLGGDIGGVPGAGLVAMNSIFGTNSTTFQNGNILLGGDGNDALRGRGGYDILDGDAWLNVRIKIMHNGTEYSAESLNTDQNVAGELSGLVFNVVNGEPDFSSPAFDGRTLNSLMLDGTINPGSLSIVREIKYDDTNVTGDGRNVDTAVFQGTRDEYDIEGITQNQNTGVYTGTAQDVDGDGFIKVRDRDTGAIGATVIQIIDGVPTPVTLNSRGALTDDIDLLRNMEQLQFADQTIVVGVPANSLATGTVTIDDPTPIVGQVLTATLSNVADADGLTLDANGLPVGLNFEWQTTEVGSNAGWTTIQTSLTYTVRSVDPGHILRAVAVFKDDSGVNERIASAPTADPTAPFIVAENSAAGTVVGLKIPFSVDYDPQPINGQPPADVDLTTIHHEIDPANSAGGRFTVIPNGNDINGFPQFSLIVNPALNNTGPLDALDTRVLLNYEAPVHTPANQSYQNPDNQYQVVINTYDAPGGTLVAVRQFTVVLTDVVEGTADQAPVLDLVGIATLTNGSFREEFTADSYTGTDQPTPANTLWTTSWVEGGGENDGSSNTGDIEIVGFNGSNQLRFDSGIDGGEFIARQVDLGGATSASLSFNYFMDDLESGENIVVEARLGNGNWVEVGTQDFLNGSNQNNGRTVSGVFDFALPQAVIGAETEIRFRAEGSWNGNDAFYIDNVNIAYSTATTTTAAPYDYAATYTENGAAVAIANNPAIADADNSFVMGATVKLTNAQAQDVLSIAGTLPAGISMSFGPAVAGEITMYLAGPVSFAAMQTAIGQVRFENTGDNPTAIARVINVTVNDGEKESNIATATINVTEVPDPFVAGDDRIVTNIGNGNPGIIVPEWALLANDIDPDGPAAVADITATSLPNNSGLSSASLTTNPGSVTIVDTGGGGNGTSGNFNYTATYGAQSDVANVQVVRDTGNVDGGNGNDILVGDGNGSAFDAGTGNDIIFAGAGDDTIVWNANNNGTTDGRDYVDGGDHSNPAISGDIVISGNGGATGNRLQFTDSTNGDEMISRAVALNPGEAATLSFTWRLDDTDGPFFIFPGDDTDVQAFDGTNWITIATLDGGIAEDTDHTFTQALTAPFIGAHTAIRFVSPNLTNGENIYIDNVQIATPSGTYRDEFGTQAYNNSDGTLPWTTSWTETNEPAGGDTFTINGNDEEETFRVYAVGMAIAAGLGPFQAGAQIIITRNVDGEEPTAEDVIAELTNVEEIIINTGGGNDVVIPIGNFDLTSLAYNTIRVNGGTGDDTVDVSGLTSDHRVVLTTDGGNDRIIGGNRAQDMVLNPDGTEVETEETEETAPVDQVSADPDTGTEQPPVVTAPTAEQPNSSGGTSGADVLTGTDQGETIESLGGDDIVFAKEGADNVLAGAGNDMVFGDGGNDRLFGGSEDDFLNGGGGNDLLIGGAGNDRFVAEADDGNDVYYGDEITGGTGSDTLDMSAITANISADLGNGYMERGSVYSSETGHDTLWNVENIVTGSGNDIITASNAVNVIDGGDGNDIFRFNSATAANGDTIASFQPGDKIDLSGFDANSGASGQQSFTLVSGGVAGAGQLAITQEMDDDGIYTVISGNVTGGEAADFKINVRGAHELTTSDFNL